LGVPQGTTLIYAVGTSLGVPQGTTLIYAVGINLGVPQGTSVHSLCSFTVLGHKKKLPSTKGRKLLLTCYHLILSFYR